MFFVIPKKIFCKTPLKNNSSPMAGNNATIKRLVNKEVYEFPFKNASVITAASSSERLIHCSISFKDSGSERFLFNSTIQFIKGMDKNAIKKTSRKEINAGDFFN